VGMELRRNGEAVPRILLEPDLTRQRPAIYDCRESIRADKNPQLWQNLLGWNNYQQSPMISQSIFSARLPDAQISLSSSRARLQVGALRI
jgi:hypothetical protein